MTLKDKLKFTSAFQIGYYYPVEDVKQFLKDLIAKFKGMEIVSGEVIEYEIKKSAGNFK